MGRDSRGRSERGRPFFQQRAEELSLEAALIRRDWPIFHWQTPDEKEREREEELMKAQLLAAGATYFDTLAHCGHRNADDMLPEGEISSFLAFQVADGDFQQWQWIEETMDEVQVTRGFAMKRTSLYLQLEDK